jgi:hypothetical protein
MIRDEFIKTANLENYAAPIAVLGGAVGGKLLYDKAIPEEWKRKLKQIGKPKNQYNTYSDMGRAARQIKENASLKNTINQLGALGM